METARHFLKFQKSSLVKRSTDHSGKPVALSEDKVGKVQDGRGERICECSQIVDDYTAPRNCEESARDRRQGLFPCHSSICTLWE